ncbi:hypothetical protein S245_033989 [Arachis hypogaea]
MSPNVAHRQELWHRLTGLAKNIVLPWMVVGDFNEILHHGEVKGGTFNEMRADVFIDTLYRCGLVDIGASSKEFTWYRRIVGNRDIAKKLDRALFNQDWCHFFLEAYTDMLSRFHFDRCPLLIRCKRPTR